MLDAGEAIYSIIEAKSELDTFVHVKTRFVTRNRNLIALCSMVLSSCGAVSAGQKKNNELSKHRLPRGMMPQTSGSTFAV